MKKLLTLALIVGNVCWGSVLWQDDFTTAQSQIGGGSNSLNMGTFNRVFTIQNPTGLAPVDTEMSSGGGILNIINGVGDNATYMLVYDWLGANTPIPVGATNIEVLISLIGTDGNLTEIELGGIGSGAFQFPENSGSGLYSFPGTPGGKLVLTFNGEDGWDLALGNVYITGDLAEVPEPATYAMVGAGLLALALRRR